MEAEDEDDDAMGVETEAALAGYGTDCKDQVYVFEHLCVGVYVGACVGGWVCVCVCVYV